VGQHSSASASRLLGLDGFEVLAAEVVGGEWQLAVQTTATVVGCIGCGVRAELREPPMGRPAAANASSRILRPEPRASPARLPIAQRSAACSPRLPGAAAAADVALVHGPSGEWSGALGPAFGRRRLRRQSEPALVATQGGAVPDQAEDRHVRPSAAVQGSSLRLYSSRGLK
jgi:hypothetical protein